MTDLLVSWLPHGINRELHEKNLSYVICQFIPPKRQYIGIYWVYLEWMNEWMNNNWEMWRWNLSSRKFQCWKFSQHKLSAPSLNPTSSLFSFPVNRHLINIYSICFCLAVYLGLTSDYHCCWYIWYMQSWWKKNVWEAGGLKKCVWYYQVFN